jgi:hypothetical protein
MKEIDDTDPAESESENLVNLFYHREKLLRERIRDLEVRIANLETQRTPQDENDDPEWFA